MGSRGFKPAPSHLKVLKGAQESRINRDEPQPKDSGEIVPPDDMDEDALEIWHDLAPDLIDKGCLTHWDRYTFMVFCNALAKYRECNRMLRTPSKHGKYVAQGSAGGIIKSPYHQIMRDCEETIAKFSSRFGFTPGDRAALKVGAEHRGPSSGAGRIIA